MTTPICDFVRRYAALDGVRGHMPGHKGKGFLGCERWDITEIHGADSLYGTSGIIRESETNAAALFGTAATLYSAEGSSQCIRAMLYLSLSRWRETNPSGRPVLVAGRNAHKTLLLSAALLDIDIVWLWPETEDFQLCRCPISAEQLTRVLTTLDSSPIAVYVTSPDYLGNQLNLTSLAETAHRFHVPLLVDNAHGAYLKFLPDSRHPMDAGADLCCDSAHKTLPVLTGGAYLHINRAAPEPFQVHAKQAMALFGSTSPSWLILQSLDQCNRILSTDWMLPDVLARMEHLRASLQLRGWNLLDTDPLKLTIAAADSGWNGLSLSDRLRAYHIECEYADPDFLSLMLSPSNSARDFQCLENAFAALEPRPPRDRPALSMAQPNVYCTIREAVFAPQEQIPASESAGRILGMPETLCPPAVPAVMSGEVIPPEAIDIFSYYHMDTVSVIR